MRWVGRVVHGSRFPCGISFKWDFAQAAIVWNVYDLSIILNAGARAGWDRGRTKDARWEARERDRRFVYSVCILSNCTVFILFFIISTRAVWDSTAKRGTHITHSKHAAGPKKRVSPRARRAREGRAMFSYFPPETRVLLGLQRKRIFWYNAQGTGHHGDGELKVSKSFFKTSIKHCEIKSSVLEDIVLN